MANTSDAAHQTWNEKYGGIKFEQPLSSLKDTGPLELIQKLGEGGWGNVYSTDLGGVAVALKLLHFFPNRQRHIYVNELEILQKLSGRRHHHIIELVGWFELVGKLKSRVGLVIWPVAQCDLSKTLHYMDILAGLRGRLAEEDSPMLDEEDADALDVLSILTGLDRSKELRVSSLSRVQQVHNAAKAMLHARIGCLAQAISYLHNDQQIRHKDLNPKQILLSAQGLWVADFGMSKDISELTSSASNNGEKASVKYHAPERESKKGLLCGRAEDIFALGCTYLEILYRLCGLPIEDHLNPTGALGWSYQANLQNVSLWIEPLRASSVAGDDWIKEFTGLVREMMAEDSHTRPRIEKVIQSLAGLQASNSPVFFGSCCNPS
ncbi:kinase-like protein [Ophiobolus disseminans]|uniref:Kinase-like protein n=1 Tax=Ophiobolus disseminans TaxID=1469910 RepID=A0A6A7A2L7_9PLEO|nr:kinase-like protein [Ophiobolus disseminans]